jgi:hypothetical protein
MQLSRVSTMAILVCAAAQCAFASPFCPADLNNDSQLDFFDLSSFIEFYLDSDPQADFDNDNRFTFFDISAFITAFSEGCPDLTDRDGDRIPDFAESNDGRFVSLMQTGTDPDLADTDGDGIDDGDELLGTLDGLDLPTLGADPLRRDIFVECDWFAGEFEGKFQDFRPTDEVILPLIEVFASAPVSNPYGAPNGINIHFDYGQGGVFNNGEQLPGEPLALFFDFEFNILKERHFDHNRRGYFHYAMFAYRYNNPKNTSSGVAELPGDDFMVTLSTFNSPQVMTNTIMHELGHNLGLEHGGFESRNWKPNYNSVMNYRYQFAGIDLNQDAFGDGPPGYSNGFAPVINENQIQEGAGIDGVTPIDWNNDGSISTDTYQANLNCVFTISECGSDINCWDSVCVPLHDNDDWGSIDWQRFDRNTDRNPQPSIIECDAPFWIVE